MCEGGRTAGGGGRAGGHFKNIPMSGDGCEILPGWKRRACSGREVCSASTALSLGPACASVGLFLLVLCLGQVSVS